MNEIANAISDLSFTISFAISCHCFGTSMLLRGIAADIRDLKSGDRRFSKITATEPVVAATQSKVPVELRILRLKFGNALLKLRLFFLQLRNSRLRRQASLMVMPIHEGRNESDQGAN